MLTIEPGRALVVVVLSAGVVKDRLARVPEVLMLPSLLLPGLWLRSKKDFPA